MFKLPFKSAFSKSKEILPLHEVAKEMFLYSMSKSVNSESMKFGVKIKDNQAEKILYKKMEYEPNAIFVGGMGTGKSSAMNTTVLSFIQSNPSNSLVFVIDPLRNAVDFNELFSLPKVYKITESEEKIHQVINLAYEELDQRRNCFSGDPHIMTIYDYEFKNSKQMDRILLVFEELSAVLSVVLKFDSEFKKIGTTAAKLFEIMKIGRRYGIWVLGATARGTVSDVSPELVASFTQKFIFRTNPAVSNYFLNNEDAANIPAHSRGYCISDDGPIQFPYFSTEDQKEIIKSIVSKENFLCLKLNKEKIIKSLSEETMKKTESLIKEEYAEFKSESSEIAKQKDSLIEDENPSAVDFWKDIKK